MENATYYNGKNADENFVIAMSRMYANLYRKAWVAYYIGEDTEQTHKDIEDAEKWFSVDCDWFALMGNADTAEYIKDRIKKEAKEIALTKIERR